MPRMYGPKPKTSQSQEPGASLDVVVTPVAEEVVCDAEESPPEES